MFKRLFFNLNVFLTFLLACTAIVGDYLVKNNFHLLAAICDNATHAIIGGVCWIIFYINSDRIKYNIQRGIVEVSVCAILASIIDLDHFIAARSVYLKDVTSLKHRPFMHCSTIPVTLFLILIVISFVLQIPSLKRAALVVLTAFMSHHIRDATRRGLWFYPYGSTSPIPYAFYILITCCIPYLILMMDRLIVVKETNISSDYSNVI